MRSYPEYKESGVEWLGQVPAGWEVRRLGICFQERRETASDKDFPPLSVTMGGVVPQLETAAKTDDGDNRRLVRAGDFVINSRSDRKGSSGLADRDGSVSLINLVLQPREVIASRYGHWLLRSIGFQEEFYRWGRGIVADLWSTRFGEMKRIMIVLPPLAEQRAIAGFLDREVAKIDALIEESRALIAALAEKRQATISHAVTRGLNPSARLKPSGVDWLGDIPEGWEVVRAGRVISILSGFAFPSEGFSQNELDTPLLRGINIGVGGLRWDEVAYWARTDDDQLNAFEVRAGDVVIGMDRPWIASGLRIAQVHESDLPCLLLQRVGLIRPDYRMNPQFLLFQYSSDRFKGFLEPEMTGVSVPHISPSQIASFPITMPPRGEQEGIIAFLDAETARLDALTEEAKAAIALLQERRAALISAAVTGKIDTRDTVAAA